MVFLPTGFGGHHAWKHIKEWTVSMTSTITACNSQLAGAVSADHINHRLTEELQTPRIKHSLPVLWGAGANPQGHLNLEKIAAGQTETISDFSPPFWTQGSSWCWTLSYPVAGKEYPIHQRAYTTPHTLCKTTFLGEIQWPMKLKQGSCQVIKTQASFLWCLPTPPPPPPLPTPPSGLFQLPKSEILLPSEAACEDEVGIKGGYRVHVRRQSWHTLNT